MAKKKKKKEYKLKSLKVFTSPESLHQGSRKYRRVFDVSEVGYIYAELALYNKLFDEGEEWTANIVFTVFNTKTNKEVCQYKKEVNIAENTNIAFIREGWGNVTKTFWKKGQYRYDVTVNGDYVGSTSFYILDAGVWTVDHNPYFLFKSVKLYESPMGDFPKPNRVYLKQFKTKATKYVNAEIILVNKMLSSDFYPFEIQANIFNDSGQLKGYCEYFEIIKDRRLNIEFTIGYGSNKGTYWKEDNYKMEILFMDEILAVVPFTVGDNEVLFNDVTMHYLPGNKDSLGETLAESEMTFEEAKADLDKLIGLEQVKKEIAEMATYMQFLSKRKDMGIEEENRNKLHLIFTGNPGTGKTTVARYLGKIYKSLGLLTVGNVLEVGRAELVGEYIGQTAPKVKALIERAKGGILFIDEAYSLTDRGDDKKDFGREVIEILMKEMSDGERDLAIIFAGYPEEMKSFVDANPGMKSRISKIINFPDYTPSELVEIAEYAADVRKVALNDEAKEIIEKTIRNKYRDRTNAFGNARMVNGIIEEAKRNLALRIMSMKDEDLQEEDYTLVIADDVDELFEAENQKTVRYPVDQEEYDNCIEELRDLIGLEEVKLQVEETFKLVQYYNRIGKDIREAFSLHMVFSGHPGTGKTTVARLIVRIYKALGILDRGHLVECDRKDFVGGYVGQTALKTNELVDSAIGGGLFIDEAYSLIAGGAHDFGREAIEILLKRMEDERGKFIVIAAGYTDEILKFLESNPGLQSRFDKHLQFSDYSEEELFQILQFFIRKENLKLEDEAINIIHQVIAKMSLKKNKFFGNARSMRKLASEIARKQHLRMANREGKLSKTEIETIREADVSYLLDQQKIEKSSVGFKRS